MIQQSREPKKERDPRQRSVKRDSSDSESASPVFCVRNEQSDVSAIPERMAFIPVRRCGAVNFFVDSFKAKEKANVRIENMVQPLHDKF